MHEYTEEQKQALRRRLLILKEELEKGNLSFAPHLLDEAKKSLNNVRYGGDGEIDLTTVDARVRSLALAVSAYVAVAIRRVRSR